MFFSAIFARDTVGLFGQLGSLPPWNSAADIRWFRRHTRGGFGAAKRVVIMGRRTWESLPDRTLPDRFNIVLSTTAHPNTPNEFWVGSLEEALQKASVLLKSRIQTRPKALLENVGFPAVIASSVLDYLEKDDSDIYDVEGNEIFVIGGTRLLKDAFRHADLERIIETRFKIQPLVTDPIYLDTTIPPDFVKSAEIPNEECTMRVWVRRRANAEKRYLELMDKVLVSGVKEVDRTGVGTVSTFGEMFRIDLSSGGFPLLTTKKMFWKGVVEELLWFLRGETNIAPLHAAGVHIWDANLLSDQTKKLNLPKGELGPIYGKQWRAFGSPHDSDPTHAVDQIKTLIDDIRSKPNSRRLILTAWNPMVVNQVALPSCHCFAQFEVKSNKLSCLVYLRSNDLFLGSPFNIASYALLTHMLAQITHLQVGELVYTVGNAHLYLSHLEQARRQLNRPNRPFPTLVLNQQAIASIYPQDAKAPDFAALQFHHFQIQNYHPLTAIPAPMAV